MSKRLKMQCSQNSFITRLLQLTAVQPSRNTTAPSGELALNKMQKVL